jgi:hypothetical protein
MITMVKIILLWFICVIIFSIIIGEIIFQKDKNKGEEKMKKRPQVEILELRLRCPECNYILESDVCNNCGCEIDTDEIMIDIQPDEILS